MKIETLRPINYFLFWWEGVHKDQGRNGICSMDPEMTVSILPLSRYRTSSRCRADAAGDAAGSRGTSRFRMTRKASRYKV